MKTLSIFAIMPFAEEFNPVFNHGIRPIARQFPGYDLVILRADTVHPSDPQLWSHIRTLIDNSDLIIVDVSGSNPNVMLEMGFAMALSREVIVITQDGKLSSDIAGHIYIKYSCKDLSRLQRDLVARIGGVLDKVLDIRSKPHTAGGPSVWDSPPPIHRPSLPKLATDQRDLGFIARERNDLETAIQHYRAACQILPGYWEAIYDLALTLWLVKEIAEADVLAAEAAQLAMENGDYSTAWKSHNFLSGNLKCAGKYEDALREIRAAYDLSHYPKALENGLPHIVPIKNRAALEFHQGNKKEFERLVRELKDHPALSRIVVELEKEIGPLPGASPV